MTDALQGPERIHFIDLSNTVTIPNISKGLDKKIDSLIY